MNSSFYNGVSGIKAFDNGIAVTANNLSNVEKSGFKQDRLEFSTVFENTITGTYSAQGYETSWGGDDVGLGVKSQTTMFDLKQGYIKQSDSEFDFAIDGDGWFGIKDQYGNLYYTRQGVYNKDSNGDLVDISGNYLLGTTSNNIQDGIVVSEDDVVMNSVDKQSKINLPPKLHYPPKSTENVKFIGTLDPTIIKDIKKDSDGKPILDPDTGETIEVEVPNIEKRSTDIYNAKSDTRYRLELIFEKHVPQQPKGFEWDVKATITDPNDIIKDPQTGEENPRIIDEKSGVVRFNDAGALTENTLPPLDNDGTQLNINLGSIYDPNTPNSGYDGLVSTPDRYTANKSTIVDGYPGGELNNYDIDENGVIHAEFSNGKYVPVAQVAIYHFQNDQGLEKVSSTYLQESANSGKAIFFKDSNDNYTTGARFLAGYIEGSNVDMTIAMTDLIIMQKSYNANSKTITTSDQMIQRAINMKK